MDVFNEELILFWTALNEQQVKYIMVGGFATNINGYQRVTDDVDIWIEDTAENRQRLRAAFAAYGMGDFEPLLRIEFIPGWTYFHLNNGMRLDVMTCVKGLEDLSYDECYDMAIRAEIHNIIIPFLHLNHLIAAKKAANRPKDQLDVLYLEKIQKILEEQEKRNG